MTFIGIVIFTVYFDVTGWSIDAACVKQAPYCEDAAHKVTNQEGRYEAHYLGEFKTIEECQKAASGATYEAKKGERLEQSFETLCVPK